MVDRRERAQQRQHQRELPRVLGDGGEQARRADAEVEHQHHRAPAPQIAQAPGGQRAQAEQHERAGGVGHQVFPAGEAEVRGDRAHRRREDQEHQVVDRVRDVEQHHRRAAVLGERGRRGGRCGRERGVEGGRGDGRGRHAVAADGASARRYFTFPGAAAHRHARRPPDPARMIDVYVNVSITSASDRDGAGTSAARLGVSLPLARAAAAGGGDRRRADLVPHSERIRTPIREVRDERFRPPAARLQARAQGALRDGREPVRRPRRVDQHHAAHPAGVGLRGDPPRPQPVGRGDRQLRAAGRRAGHRDLVLPGRPRRVLQVHDRPAARARRRPREGVRRRRRRDRAGGDQGTARLRRRAHLLAGRRAEAGPAGHDQRDRRGLRRRSRAGAADLARGTRRAATASPARARWRGSSPGSRTRRCRPRCAPNSSRPRRR